MRWSEPPSSFGGSPDNIELDELIDVDVRFLQGSDRYLCPILPRQGVPVFGGRRLHCTDKRISTPFRKRHRQCKARLAFGRVAPGAYRHGVTDANGSSAGAFRRSRSYASSWAGAPPGSAELRARSACTRSSSTLHVCACDRAASHCCTRARNCSSSVRPEASSACIRSSACLDSR